MQVRINVTKGQWYSGWRFLHAAEGGYVNPPGMPAVRPALNAPPVDFTQPMQLMSYDLNEGRISRSKWRVVYGSQTMITNDQSWTEKICRDYVNGLDLDAVNEQGKPSYPKLMKGIACGGMFVRGRVDGDYLVCEPGISAVDANQPIPSFQTVLKENKYFQAVTSGEKVFNILGSPVPILIPYILKVPVRYPLEWFQKWEREYLPDPMKFYV